MPWVVALTGVRQRTDMHIYYLDPPKHHGHQAEAPLGNVLLYDRE
jgi:hypothetical protein